MQEFTFTVTRDITESTRVVIEASSIQAAHQLALTQPPSTGWTIDDNYPSPAYIPDPDDYEATPSRSLFAKNALRYGHTVYIILGQVTDTDVHPDAQLGDPEWQFSDGPPGMRGYSEDYTDLAEGLANFAGVKLVYVS